MFLFSRVWFPVFGSSIFGSRDALPKFGVLSLVSCVCLPEFGFWNLIAFFFGFPSLVSVVLLPEFWFPKFGTLANLFPGAAPSLLEACSWRIREQHPRELYPKRCILLLPILSAMHTYMRHLFKKILFPGFVFRSSSIPLVMFLNNLVSCLWSCFSVCVPRDIGPDTVTGVAFVLHVLKLPSFWTSAIGHGRFSWSRFLIMLLVVLHGTRPMTHVP